MDDQTIEQEIQSKGLSAPRITPNDIEATISSEHYFSALDGVDGHYRGGWQAQAVADATSLRLLTFCVLVLKNGFTVVGKSACASPENFDEDIGRKVARQNAVQEIRPLEGYRLRCELAEQA
nr:Gp49 family protein [uncultured Cohaesibacter sp.]